MASYDATAVAETPTEDKLWLLACSEIWSDGYQYDSSKPNGYGYARLKEGEQYQYYKTATNGVAYNNSSGNPKLVKKNLNESAKYWWLRSLDYIGSICFCYVGSNGFTNTGGASGDFGVSFGFSI